MYKKLENIKDLSESEIEEIKLHIISLSKEESLSCYYSIIRDYYNYIDDREMNEENNKDILMFLRDKRFVNLGRKKPLLRKIVAEFLDL